MKTVAIFCRSIDPNGHPFNDPYYWNTYLDLLLLIKSRGANAYFVAGNKNYLGNGVFQDAYSADTKVPVENFYKHKNIKAGVVFEKGGFEADDVIVLNPKFVSAITESKIETYRLFGAYQPKTYVCKNQRELEAAFLSLKSELVVVKTPVSFGGDQVYIGARDNYKSHSESEYPVIVQEFIDTGSGIQGLTPGRHDLRINIMGGNIVAGSIRVPKAGEYRSNVSQGGYETHITAGQIPAEPLRIAKEIDAYFSSYNRYYSADFANSTNGWRLIELNSKPGIDPVSRNIVAKHTLESLADYLIEICV